jgi:predicted nucleotidyltransferase
MYKIYIPTTEDMEKLISAKLSYEAAQAKPDKDAWNKKHFNLTPWGISYNISKSKYTKSAATGRNKNKTEDEQRALAMRYFIVAVAIGWQELIDQLKRTIKNWGVTEEVFKDVALTTWKDPKNIQLIADAVEAQSNKKIVLVEAIEKHDSLNNKLFTKDEVLKDKVRDKMLEIVDEFLADLKEQEIDIKVEDILFIGSNASYNYTKDSDIDLHILTNTKATKYSAEIAGAIYSAYRSLFNKNLDIEFFGIPVEIFIETEDSTRVSNGIYSVKKNKWVKKPVQEEIPDYDTKALDKLVAEWEDKCVKLIDEIKTDKLKNEDKVVKMLENIYEKLRKKGISKGEYSVENLAFKELRNKGYLDQLKDYKHDLVSKRLSLEEKLDRQMRVDVYNQLSKAAGTQPIIQDNGMFFIYNIKPSEINSKVQAIKKLPLVAEVHAYENGKYDFSNVLDLAMNKMPSKYYDIRGMLNMN